MGSVFLKTPQNTANFFSRGAILFLFVSPHFVMLTAYLLTQLLTSALFFSALTSMAEIPALFSQRPIVLRHDRAALYHPFIEALALTLVDIPFTFATSIVFSIILYFMTGLQRTASQFLYVTSQSIQVAFVLIDVHVASLYCSYLPYLLL